MPTYQPLPQFLRDHSRLTVEQKRLFRSAVDDFVADLKGGDGFRAGLRVKGVRGEDGVFEMTWAQNGRATFMYGASIRNGEPHIIWRRVGDHQVL